jgi:membrane protease YdiL (CAAX protease family)
MMDRVPTSRVALPRGQSILAGIGLALAFGFVLLESIAGLVLPGFSQRVWLDIAIQWFTASVVALAAFHGLGLRIFDLGIRIPRLADWSTMVLLLFFSVVSVGLANRLLPDTTLVRQTQPALSDLHLPVRVVLVLTAGICEEFLFRGYGIHVLSRYTGSKWSAGVLTLFFFTIAHAATVGWTMHLIFPFLIGTFLTLLYLWRENLVITAAMHTLIDTIGIILVPLVK